MPRPLRLRHDDALAGGRAPKAWRGRTVAAAGAPSAWKRAAAWLEGLVHPPRKLLRGPLWGDALAAVAGSPERPAQEVPRPRRSSVQPKSPHPRAERKASEPGRRTRRPRSAHAAEEKARREPIPSTSQRQASRKLLDRLATPLPGPSTPTLHTQPGLVPSPEADGSPPARQAAARQAAARQATARQAAAQQTVEQGRKLRDGLEGLVRRVRRKLRGTESARRSLTEQPDQVPRPSPASVHVDGESASRALLKSCLEHVPSAGEPRPHKETRRVPNPRGPSPSASSGTAATPAPSPVREAATPPPVREAATPPPLAQADTEPSTVAGPVFQGEAPRALSTTPDAASLAPSLLPRHAADFTPEAASAQVLRLAGHRGPGAFAGGDETELAEKLGRILAEEARRHGIDV